MPTRSPNSRSVIAPKSLFVNALAGKHRRFCCCRVFGPPRSSGQVSKATQGVMAMRAPSGHLMGLRFGLAFMLPPELNFVTHATLRRFFPSAVENAMELFRHR